MRDCLIHRDADWKCRACGCTVKPGQAHYALKPYPHASLAAMIVVEKLQHFDPEDASPEDAFSMRYLASEIVGK